MTYLKSSKKMNLKDSIRKRKHNNYSLSVIIIYLVIVNGFLELGCLGNLP